MIHPTAKIHPSAIIDDGATIGEKTEIGAYSVINKNVILGKNNKIKSHVILEGDTEIGNDNLIDAFSLIGARPQDPKYDNEPTYTVIGNKNIFRNQVHIESGITTTLVCDNNYFMTCSGVGHDCKVGNKNIFSTGVSILGSCIIEDNINFGFSSSCHQGSKIGSYSMIAANTFTKKNVLPFSLMKGNPSKLAGPNYVGMKRNGFSRKDIQHAYEIFKLLTSKENLTLKQKYNIIRLSNNNVSDKINLFLELYN